MASLRIMVFYFYCSSFNLIHHSLSNYNQSKHKKSREQMRHGIIYVTEGIRKRGIDEEEQKQREEEKCSHTEGR